MHHHALQPALSALGLAVIGLLSAIDRVRSSEATVFQAVDLRCEYLVDPIAIDGKQPRLSWRIESNARGAEQSAYRILVASKAENLTVDRADLWDSGKVTGRQTTHIVYEGRPLHSRDVCYWRVHVWGQADGPREHTSHTACWAMGLLDESDWTAEYISYRDESPVWKDRQQLFLPAARQYRKQFQAGDRQIQRATIYATALGIYELYLNGQRVGDEWFAPGWTDYRQRAYYRAYDVTELLRSGRNALGAWVADGWYSGYVGFGLLTSIGTERIGRYTYGKTPSIMAQLEIEYDDGSRQVVGTDTSWRVTGGGPIQEADFLMGETYDARREQPGWCAPGFDDTGWQTAILASENGQPQATFYQFRNPARPSERLEVRGEPVDLGFKRPKLEAFPGVPVRVMGQLEPIDVRKVDDGKYLYNLGQNFAGTIRLKVKGPAGLKLTLRYGEMLYPDGRLMTENLRKARATDYYILRGAAQGETYIPRFTFHGFQYVELSADDPASLPAAPQIVGLVLHSDTPLASTFECSDPMVNRLFQNVVWTQRANFIDLPTDCPQRDERMGWTGDAQVYVGTATYNADVAAFYTKWLRELMESQRPSGAFPGYAPFPFQHGWDFGTAWADAGVICPWTIWQAYGDTRVIQRCWEPMTRFMEWRRRTSRDHLGVVHGNNWGDWLAQGETTPLDYIDTIYFAISSKLMAEMATAISRDEEAKAYRDQFAKIKQAYGEKYVNRDGSLTVNTQTAYALALFADLIPEPMRPATGKRLATMIERNGTRMSTGFLGTRPLLPVLTDVGQHELAVFLFQSRAFPSWGYEVSQGATTIWERWDSYTKEDGFGRHNAAMNSFSHYAFGAVCEWMFNTLAGIRTDGPGYEKIVIHPRPAAPGSNAERGTIHWVKATHQCQRGRIVSAWRVTDGQFELVVEIPANASATVVVPATAASELSESGRTLAEAAHVELVRRDDTQAVLAVRSGVYRFVSTNALPRAAKAYRTTEPPDRTTNPEDIDLQDAELAAEWDFTQDAAIAEWPRRNNVKVERRQGRTLLVSTGADPQIETAMDAPLDGKLAVALTARSASGAKLEFFWAGPGEDYRADRSNAREIKPSESLKQYLFRIGGEQPVQKLRFDPAANEGRLEVESLKIYRLAR